MKITVVIDNKEQMLSTDSVEFIGQVFNAVSTLRPFHYDIRIKVESEGFTTDLPPVEKKGLEDLR